MRAKIVLMTAFLASCSAVTSPKGSVRATVSVSSSVLRLGIPMVVRITVENTGTKAVTIAANECPEQFVVTRADGTIVGPGTRICSLGARSQVLQAGEQVVFSSTWSGDALPLGSNAANGTLPPGNYLIKPSVLELASTNSVPIQVVP
ncbi:MAG: hypothetical protein ABJC26_00050 [Gemmatimonadaceae bacterium]